MNRLPSESTRSPQEPELPDGGADAAIRAFLDKFPVIGEMIAKGLISPEAVEADLQKLQDW